MVDDAHPPASESEPVIPPPPPAAPGDLSSSIPLAPPLSGPPASPASPPPASGAPVAPPAPPLPPYAAGHYPPQQPGQYPPQQPGQYPAGQQASALYGAAYPYPSAPPTPPSRSGRTLGIVIAAVAAFVLIIAVGIGVAVSLLVGSREPLAAPMPSATAAAPSAPSDEPSTEDPPADEPGDADASGIADVLQAKIDEYKRLRDSGALWERIPDSEFNRTAVSAFLYFLTDMKVATIWGVDETQAQEYEERMTMLEERLLAEQPLGDDIQITLEDEVFTYDGETGEGGYSAR